MPCNLKEYRRKSDEELQFIIKDAGEAAKAFRGWNPETESKYLDQVNDACTVLDERRRKGGWK